MVLIYLLQHTKRRHLQKYEKKKRYVHYSLLIVHIISCSQYNTYASYKFDTVYYLKHLRYLQCITYSTDNAILILLIMPFIIQQIVTMPIYGKEALNICHPT